MSKFRFALSSLLAAAPLLGLAQRSAPAPYPRYYVGLSLYSSDYQPLSGGAYQGTTVPVQLTLGYQLRPRLAVQASVAYSSAHASYFGAGKYYTGSAAAASPYAYFEYTGTNSTRTASTTLLARYTLTRRAHRFQVDVLGGFTLVNRRYTYAGMRTDSDSTQTVATTSNYGYSNTQNDGLVTVGAGARYRFGRHLEALLDVTISHNLISTRVTDFPSATSLGLRYRFGGL